MDCQDYMEIQRSGQERKRAGDMEKVLIGWFVEAFNACLEGHIKDGEDKWREIMNMEPQWAAELVPPLGTVTGLISKEDSQ